MKDEKTPQKPALNYHEYPKPGKLEIRATKPMANGRDLSLAYSPGVADACMEIKATPSDASRYTARGNLVAVVTNGSAVLGLGNIGALASKPVMEGKAVLFKKFANIDCFDIELDESDPEKLANIICAMEPSFGAINLEDIKAPDCFIVEQICRERMNIPVFHDDQHGTAIVVGAAATNALKVVGKDFADIKVVSTGGGAAGIACLNMLLKLGVKRENVWLCDIEGLVYAGREKDMTPQKAEYAQGNAAATLDEVIEGRRPVPGPVGSRRAETRNGREDGEQAGGLRPGQPDAGDHAGRGAQGCARCDHRHGTQRFSQSGQQRAVFSLHLPGRTGRGCDRDQRRHAAGLYRRHRGLGPCHDKRRGRGCLQGRTAELRGRLPDPETLRPTPDGRGRQRGRQGGDGQWCGHPPPALLWTNTRPSWTVPCSNPR